MAATQQLDTNQLSESRKRCIEAAAKAEANILLAKLGEIDHDDPLHILLAKAYHMSGRDRSKLWTIRYGDISPEMQKKWPRSKLEKYRHQGLFIKDHKTMDGWLTAHINVSIRDLLNAEVGKPTCFNTYPQRVRENIACNIYEIETGSWDFTPDEFIVIDKKTRLEILKSYFESHFFADNNALSMGIYGRPQRKKQVFLEMCEIWKPPMRVWDRPQRWKELKEIAFYDENET